MLSVFFYLFAARLCLSHVDGHGPPAQFEYANVSICGL